MFGHNTGLITTDLSRLWSLVKELVGPKPGAKSAPTGLQESDPTLDLGQTKCIDARKRFVLKLHSSSVVLYLLCIIFISWRAVTYFSTLILFFSSFSEHQN